MQSGGPSGVQSQAWQRIVDEARWAPSPHNTQPWRVRVTGERTAELLCDAQRLLPVEDPGAFFMLVGFGIFLEALDVAAAPLGLAVQASDWASDISAGPALRHVADLTLVDRKGPAAFEATLLRQRRTSRVPYDARALDGEAQAACSRIAAASASELSWSSDADLVEWILDLNQDTLFLDMADDATRREVGSWVRSRDRDATAKRDGLWAKCLGFPGWLLSAFFRRPRLLRLPVVRGVVRRTYLRSTRGTITVAWLSSPVATPAQRVEAGRMLMRIWLELTRRGAYLHPFGSIITNKDANARLQARLATRDGTKRLWLAFRAGYSPEPPRSLRLDAAEVLA